MRAAVAMATTQVGVREVPQNRGPKVAMYLRATRLGVGHPWCLAFLVWAYDTTRQGRPLPLMRTASTWRLWQWATTHATAAPWAPQSGDLVIWNLPGTVNGHAEIIRRVHAGGWVTTVGGNTLQPGRRGDVRDGGGVWQHRRLLTHPLVRLRLRGTLGFTL